MTLTNSTVSGNVSALSGGGIANGGACLRWRVHAERQQHQRSRRRYLDIGAVDAVNSTISGNKTTDLGGGIFQQGSAGAV